MKVGKAAGKTMLMCGRSSCAEQTLLLGSFVLLGEGRLCDLMVAAVDLAVVTANWLCFSATLVG